MASVEFGGVDGVRDARVLEGALERPLATFAGEQLYGSPFARAAALMHSIVEGRPFVGANRAVALLAAAFWLEREGYRFEADQPDALQATLGVAAGERELDDTARWLREHAVRLDR
ncbi:MAG TPA: Fic family protein [Chloroflexota bacterium]